MIETLAKALHGIGRRERQQRGERLQRGRNIGPHHLHQRELKAGAVAIRLQPQRLGELGFGTFMHADLGVLGAEQVADVRALGRLLPSPLQAVERDTISPQRLTSRSVSPARNRASTWRYWNISILRLATGASRGQKPARYRWK